MKSPKFQRNKESIIKLKTHLELMKKELDGVSSQIKTFEKSKTRTEWEKIEFQEGNTINELREHEKKLSKEIATIKKEIKHSKSRKVLLTELFLLPVVFVLIMTSGAGNVFLDSSAPIESTSFKTRHMIENLRGDTVDTWKSWRLVGTSMNVNIVNAKGISDEQVDVIKNSIVSEKILEIDDSISHKGPKGSNSLYFEGWSGALLEASKNDSRYNIPVAFNTIQSYDGEGDIIITLSNLRDNDGYTGYTKSIVDGNEILKSFITIYDVSNLSDEELSTIVRHEFCHALGLGHSTSPEDLIAPTIEFVFQPAISSAASLTTVEIC